MTLITQIIISVITFAIMLMKKYFHKIHEQEKAKTNDEQDQDKIKKYKMLSKIFGIITMIGVIYFIFYLVTTTPFTFWNTILAFVKMIIFVLIFMAILYDGEFDSFDEEDIQIIAFIIVVSIIAVLIGLGINSSVQKHRIEKNIIINEEIQYVKKEYKLSKEFNAIDSEENDIVENSVSEYFDYEITRYNSGNVSREYSICYVDKKGDLIFKELDDDDTKLVPLKKDETPYLEVKTYTQYGMDNNKNPPEQIIVKEDIKYVIHVLQEDIDKVLKLEKEE